MGGTSSKGLNYSKALPLSHWSIPIFGARQDTEIIFDALFLNEKYCANTTGYFLYTPKSIESSPSPSFSNEKIIQSSRSNINDMTFKQERLVPFGTAHQFEIVENDKDKGHSSGSFRQKNGDKNGDKNNDKKSDKNNDKNENRSSTFTFGFSGAKNGTDSTGDGISDQYVKHNDGYITPTHSSSDVDQYHFWPRKNQK